MRFWRCNTYVQYNFLRIYEKNLKSPINLNVLIFHLTLILSLLFQKQKISRWLFCALILLWLLCLTIMFFVMAVIGELTWRVRCTSLQLQTVIWETGYFILKQKYYYYNFLSLRTFCRRQLMYTYFLFWNTGRNTYIICTWKTQDATYIYVVIGTLLMGRNLHLPLYSFIHIRSRYNRVIMWDCDLDIFLWYTFHDIYLYTNGVNFLYNFIIVLVQTQIINTTFFLPRETFSWNFLYLKTS